MTKSLEALVARKEHAVTGSYYLAKCENCEEIFSSGKMTGGEPLYSGDYGDSYCPHCGVDDSEISDYGNDALEAWNFQQKHIDALIAELEQLQQANAAQDDHINQQADRVESLEKKNSDLGRALIAAEKRSAELESNKELIGFRCKRSDGLGEWHCAYHREPDDFDLKHQIIERIHAVPRAATALCVKPGDAMREVAPLCVKLPDGWVMVPSELTPGMQDAWDSAPNGNEDDDENMRNAYRAMIAAAPQPDKCHK